MREIHKRNLHFYAEWLQNTFISSPEMLAYNRDYTALKLLRSQVDEFYETGDMTPFFKPTHGNDGRRHPLALAPLCLAIQPVDDDFADEFYRKDVGYNKYQANELILDTYIFRVFGINAGKDVFWAMMFSPQSATFDRAQGIPTVYNILFFLHCIGFGESTVPRKTDLKHHQLNNKN